VPDGLGGSGGTGAEAQLLFLPEPDTRKTGLTRAGQAGADADQFKPEGILAEAAEFANMILTNEYKWLRQSCLY
jgi:hypothetical protein